MKYGIERLISSIMHCINDSLTSIIWLVVSLRASSNIRMPSHRL